MSKQTLQEAIKKYKSLSLEQKERFVKETASLVISVEDYIDEYFADDPLARELYKEQLRDMAQADQITVQDDSLAHVPCAKNITYELFNRAFSANISSKKPEDLARKAKTLWAKRQSKRDKDMSNSEFMQYVRGYSKYWHNDIDENNCEEEIGDIDWIIEQIEIP